MCDQPNHEARPMLLHFPRASIPPWWDFCGLLQDGVLITEYGDSLGLSCSEGEHFCPWRNKRELQEASALQNACVTSSM